MKSAHLMVTREQLDHCVQILLGLVFLVTGTLKLIGVQEFIYVVKSYGIMSEEASLFLALGTVSFELVLGLSLAFGLWPDVGMRGAIGVLLLFTGFAVYAVANDTGWVCSCFGGLFSPRFSYFTIIRNVLLLSLALYAFRRSGSRMRFDKLSDRVSTVLTISVVAGFATLAAIGNLQDTPKLKQALVPGSRFDDLASVVLADEVVTSAQKTQPYFMVILFTLEDCSSCLSEVFQWEHLHKEYSSRVMVVGIAYAEGGEQLLRAWQKSKRLTFPIFFDSGKKVMDKYDIVTPYRIVVNRRSKVILADKVSNSQKKRAEFIQALTSLIRFPA